MAHIQMWVTADLLAQSLLKTSIHFVIWTMRCYAYSPHICQNFGLRTDSRLEDMGGWRHLRNVNLSGSSWTCGCMKYEIGFKWSPDISCSSTMELTFSGFEWNVHSNYWMDCHEICYRHLYSPPMTCNDLEDALTFHLVPSLGQTFCSKHCCA